MRLAAPQGSDSRLTFRMLRCGLLLLIALAPALGAQAQQLGTSAPQPPARAPLTLALPVGFNGAAPPQLPATVSRDEEGRTTVRAVRLTQPLTLDGALDEDLYRTLQPITDFIQSEPMPGAPATERTEVWISFDDDNIYVSIRALESEPKRMIANEMRRDNFGISQNDSVFFAFDTFEDGRNSFVFQFNSLGGRSDGQVANESQYNGDFNPIWRLAVRRTEDGWTGEAAVPFKSLRYGPGRSQVWGFQARRVNRWKNETSYLTQLPAGLGGQGGQRVSRYAKMVGLEVPAANRALDLKPYLTSDVSTDRTATPSVSNKIGKDVGFDVKYAVTQGLTTDVTVNTDFAQVEADEQQVNLTRFSLFFPEKREFFLENSGVFTFAGATGRGQQDQPTLFYSRRIGLDSGVSVPLDVGARLSGRVGRYGIGILNIQTGDVKDQDISPTNFSVVRVRRDILQRSAVGLIFTNRSRATTGPGSAQTAGLDGSFSFFQNLSINTYVARTATPGLKDDDTSYRGQFFYNGDRWGAQAEWLNVGANFQPELGFVRRRDFTKKRTMVRFSPRTVRRFTAVRKFTYQASMEFFDNSANQMETRERRLEFSADLRNGDGFEANYENTRELLLDPFDVATGVTIPAGSFDVNRVRAAYEFGQQRPVSGTVYLEQGVFYSGRRTAFGYSGGRLKLTPQFSVEPGIQINRVRLRFGDFTTRLVNSRVTYTLTPLMFVSGLLQYNSSNHSLTTNVRFRWEYQPGSELFLVYNDGRDTEGGGAPVLMNRSIVFKINRLFRF